MHCISNKKDDNAIKIGNALLRQTTLHQQQRRGSGSIQNLDVNVTGLTRRGALALAKGIASSPTLIALSIQGQALDHEEVMAILFRQGILPNTSIVTLNLVASIGCVDAFGDLLSNASPQLQCLKLWSSATTVITTTVNMTDDRDNSNITNDGNDDYMPKVCQALANNVTLEELWIGLDGSHLYTNRRYDDNFFRALAKRSKPLTRLQLRGEQRIPLTVPDAMDLDDEDHPNGERRRSLLSSLQVLLLQSSSLSSHSTTAPREVEIQNCNFPEADWFYLGKALSAPCTNLSSLSITNCPLTCTSLEYLRQGLTGSNNTTTSSSSSLSTLRLCRNQLGDAGLQVLLAQGFTSHLTSLALINNQIGDAGVTHLVEHLGNQLTDTVTTTTTTTGSQLQHLDLMNNIIGPAGAQLLFQAITTTTKLPVLQTLNLAENANIGLEGLTQLGDNRLAQLQLQSLDLSWRLTWPQQSLSTPSAQQQFDIAANAKDARAMAGEALVHGMQSNYHLQELVVSEVDFPMAIRKRIAFYTELNKCGRRRLLTNNTAMTTTTTTPSHGGSEAIWSHVLAKCANNNNNNNATNNNNSNATNSNNNHTSAMFYFLQQKPELIVGATMMRD